MQFSITNAKIDRKLIFYERYTLTLAMSPSSAAQIISSINLVLIFRVEYSSAYFCDIPRCVDVTRDLHVDFLVLFTVKFILW